MSHQAVRAVLAASLSGAGLVHAAQVLPHAREWFLAGAFFAVVATLQLALGAATVASPSGFRAPAAVLSTVVLAVWVVSRTIGLPFGPHGAEAVGRADLVASGLEVVTLAAVTVARRGSFTRAAVVASVPVVVAASLFALAPASTTHEHLDVSTPSSEVTRAVDYLRGHAEHGGHAHRVTPRP